MKQIDYNGMDTKIEKKSKFSKKMICIIIGSITILFLGVLWITFRVNSSYECKQRWYNNFYCTKRRI